MSSNVIISSKIINTKHQMLWNKDSNPNPTLGNTWSGETRLLSASKVHLK